MNLIEIEETAGANEREIIKQMKVNFKLLIIA